MRGKRTSAVQPRTQPRDRARPMMVYVNDEEREQIERAAADAGLTVSSYLRAAGLGRAPRSVLDLRAVETLAEISAAQTRLVHLIKGSTSGSGVLLLQVAGFQEQLERLARRVA
jgi:hypothetical protein